YVIRCDDVEKDAAGNVVRLLCSHDASTRHGGAGADKRKVKGTIHWVSKGHALAAEVRLYDRLFTVPAPDREDADFLTFLNPESKVVVTAMVEPSLATLGANSHVQFERQGYFFSDPLEHRGDALVFNKVVGLRDSWAKQRARAEGQVEAPRAAPKAPKTESTRPERLSRAELRDRRFAEDPRLKTRFEALQSEAGLSEDDADLLSDSHALADFF
ncbi:MAG: glutamine--tRNA ligase, partial [Myxococcales bacterium]|nr:glutamine--tRNA ligase [Myxococcales bacterium]